MNGNNWGCIYDPDMVAHVQNVYANGHQIASHTWSHPDISKLTNAQLDVEIMRLDQAFIKILGIKPNIFRPPYGSVTAAQVDYITTKHKKKVVTWDLDSEDTQGADTNAEVLAFYKTLAQQAEASNKMPRAPEFTLAHDVQPQTGTSSLEAATILLDADYTLITTAQCLDTEPYTYIGPPQTRDSTWTCDGTWDVSQYSEGTTSSSSGSSSTTSTIGSSTTLVSSTGTTSSTTPSSTACSKTYTVKSGDYCYLIAQNNGLTVDQLQAANPGMNCDTLQIGQVLSLCPSTSSTSSPPTSTSSTSPVTTSAPISISTSTTPAPSTVTTTPASSCPKSYTVKSGDYCYAIATNNGLTTAQLQAANPKMNCNNLQIGQVITIPCAGSSSSSSLASTTKAPSTTTTKAPSTPAPTTTKKSRGSLLLW
ncbi:hypothetical protein VKT23_001642 [Stygiomarasmius scandens]|uniref:Chitin deacetylase n=1 Tax=Marasmiellus scandens TaxID=2682957 RepID=A0ABR1JZH7_9AGAR